MKGPKGVMNLDVQRAARRQVHGELNGLKRVGCLKSSSEDSPGTKGCEVAMKDLGFCSKCGEV